MNVPTLKMNPAEAEDKYSAFAASRRRDPETQQATEIYRLLAEGKTLVDVAVAIRSAPVDAMGRPRLAFARADRPQVRMVWPGSSDVIVFDTLRNRGSFGNYPQMVEQIVMNRRHGQRTEGTNGHWYQRTLEAWALVPVVPADIKFSGPLSKYHILWEVEAWSDAPLRAEPDRDPYLLRRVSGDLFEVIAEWDLTEVERYVMAGRARVQQ